MRCTECRRSVPRAASAATGPVAGLTLSMTDSPSLPGHPAVSPVDARLLRQVPLFASLPAADLELLARSLQARRLSRGEALVHQGEVLPMLGVLVQGRARVMVEDRRRRRAVLLSTLMPGDAIGEMSMIDGQPHSATVRAETPCEVWLLERAALEACLSRSNAMIYALMCTLVRRLRHAYAHIALLATLDVAGRLACTLLERGEAGGDGRWRLDGRISRTELALRVGATRERVSRVLAEFERRGHIVAHPDGGWWIEPSLRDIATQSPSRQRDDAFGEELGDTELGEFRDESPDTGPGTEPGPLPRL